MADEPGFNEQEFNRNVWAGTVHDLFVGLVTEGFTEEQAMRLMISYIGSNNA